MCFPMEVRLCSSRIVVIKCVGLMGGSGHLAEGFQIHLEASGPSLLGEGESMALLVAAPLKGHSSGKPGVSAATGRTRLKTL